jgi:hypothetical protein
LVAVPLVAVPFVAGAFCAAELTRVLTLVAAESGARAVSGGCCPADGVAARNTAVSANRALNRALNGLGRRPDRDPVIPSRGVRAVVGISGRLGMVTAA